MKNKTYTLLNMVGLAIGLAVSIIIYLYLQSEARYDTSISNYRDIYRINAEFQLNKEHEKVAGTSLSLGPLLAQEYDYIDGVTRFRHYDNNVLFRYADEEHYESEIAIADSNFFRVFDISFIAGNPDSCLLRPHSIVVTQSFAQRYFGKVDPINKVISTNNYDYRITGLIEDLPANTHHDFEAVISAFYQPIPEDRLQQSLWGAAVYTFLRLDEPGEVDRLHHDFKDFYKKYMLEAGENLGGFYDIKLARLDKIHYGESFQFDRPLGQKTYLYAFGAIGLLILILACINYVNMATARGMRRVKEAGLRKILGSSSGEIRMLILAESVVLALVSLFVAFVLVELVLELTAFNDILSKDLRLNFQRFPALWWLPLSLAMAVGLLSGWYPAYALARVKGLAAIRGGYQISRKSKVLRKFLVAFQFCISVAVVITALLMHRQMEYIRSKDLGFNKEDVVLVPIQDTAISQKIPDLKKKLMDSRYVHSASLAWSVPGESVDRTLLNLETDGGFEKDVVDIMHVGMDYLETMEIKLLRGRDFTENDLRNEAQAILVNREMMEQMQWQDPVGKKVQWGFDESGKPLFEGRVVGVVENFNSHSLHEPIEATVLFLQDIQLGSMHVRVDTEHLMAALKEMEQIWGEVDERSSFRFSFLNKDLLNLYQEEHRQSTIILYLTYLAIFISFLGLTGLASFTTSLRTREIGIRKVLGADVRQMVNLIFKDMLLMVVGSVLLAIPLAYFLIRGWLSGFAYSASLDPLIFAFSATAAVALAYLIVSYHSIRVARANPVDTLKYE